MLAALLYSAGSGNPVGILVRNIPIINANRWWVIGLFYVTIFLIFQAVAKVSALKETQDGSKVQNVQVLRVGVASLCLLVLMKSSALNFSLLAVSLLLVWLLGKEKNQIKWENLLTALITLNVLSIVSMQFSYPLNSTYSSDAGSNSYSQQVSVREKEVVITQNHRRLGEGNDYIYNDEQWLLKKIPFSHGYNNLGNPYYWYVKNKTFLERLVFVTQNVRREIELQRNSFASDNAFAEAMMGDVLAEMGRPTIDATHFHDLLQYPDFKWKLNELKVEPNTANMRVTTDAAAFLIFNNVDHPGWEVYVNGKKAELVRTNRIFQGVYLDGAGSHDVVFKFRPALTIALILLPYIVLLFCLFFYMQKIRSRIKLRGELRRRGNL